MKMFKSLAFVMLCANFWVLHAHVPFLKPNQFNVLHSRLHIESSFTEDPFQADFAMLSEAYLMISSTSEIQKIEPSFKTAAAVYLEPQITDSGTYRIHSALRKGPKYRAIETANGKLYFADDIVKHTGKHTFLQYFSSADTYLTLGASNYKTFLMKKGVEIIPLSSPNEIYTNTETKFRIYMDGVPASNARVVVAYDNDHHLAIPTTDLYDVENKRANNIYANSNGEFTFKSQKAGLLMLFVTIHKKNNDNLWESYNNSVTLEIRLPLASADKNSKI